MPDVQSEEEVERSMARLSCMYRSTTLGFLVCISTTIVTPRVSHVSAPRGSIGLYVLFRWYRNRLHLSALDHAVVARAVVRRACAALPEDALRAVRRHGDALLRAAHAAPKVPRRRVAAWDGDGAVVHSVGARLSKV